MYAPHAPLSVMPRAATLILSILCACAAFSVAAADNATGILIAAIAGLEARMDGRLIAAITGLKEELTHNFLVANAGLEARMDVRLVAANAGLKEELTRNFLVANAGLEARMDGRLVAAIAGLEARMNVRLDGLATTSRSIEESVVTIDVAARLEECAPKTALLSLTLIPQQNYTLQCSALPLPLELLPIMAGHATSSRYFLTSAHCFIQPYIGTKKLIGNVTRIYSNNRTYNCALHAHQILLNRSDDVDDIDVAFIFCSEPVPVPPTRLSAATYMAQRPVAMMGFSLGLHVDPHSMVPFPSPGIQSYSRHVRHTRLANSLQTPTTAAAFGAVSAGGDLTPVPAFSWGYTVEKPAQGMSGGAVVDSSCGVLGITEKQSVHAPGGRFVRLSQAVQDWAARHAAEAPGSA